ncbi:MAG: S8 family serine peptidase, partial [Anaerolineae bacterium]
MKNRLLIPLLLAVLFLLPFAGLAAAPPPSTGQISPHLLAQLEGGQPAPMLVILNEQADLSAADRLAGKTAKGKFVYRALWQTAQTSQAPLRQWLNRQGIPYRSFYIVNALLVEGDRSLALALAARPDVARLEANPAIRNSLPSPVPQTGHAPAAAVIESNLLYVNADDVWALGFTGQGIVVGGQDTGYDWDHPALVAHYRGWDGAVAGHNYNWHDSIHAANASCPADSPEPCDDFGHGTHTMGTAIGDDGAGNQIGMAPGATWMGCRNMNGGDGTPASYLERIANKQTELSQQYLSS